MAPSPDSQRLRERKCVLLVEDNIDALTIYAASLRYAGYDVIEAPTIAEATAAVLERRPDIVVLDCRLPDGDGLMLLESWRRKRSSGSMKDVPVIVLTASAHRQDIDAALLAGADQFVPKPCPGNVLAMHVARALDGTRPSARLRKVVRE
jgi:two-component system, OmpR family, response regulator